MAVTKTPLNGRLRLNYTGSAPSLQLSGFDPSVTAVRLNLFVSSVLNLQTTTRDTAYFSVESELHDN